MSEKSTRPYLIRAIHEWCADNGFRPFIAVVVDERTQVPREFVRDGQIVLNVATHATNRLRLGNDLIEFEARFNGVARQISIPVENVAAIYAAENGEGMAFEVARPDAGADAGADALPGEPRAGEQSPAPLSSVPAQPAEQAPAPLSAVPAKPLAPAREDSATPREPGPPESPGPASPPRRPTLTRVK